jgi:hypothetical protein
VQNHNHCRQSVGLDPNLNSPEYETCMGTRDSAVG